MKNKFACDVCYFLFEADQRLDQYLNCGKYIVRLTAQEEHDENEKNRGAI
jgi:hypothetical protein